MTTRTEHEHDMSFPPTLALYLVRHPETISIVSAHTADDAAKLVFDNLAGLKPKLEEFVEIVIVYEINSPDKPKVLHSIRR